MWRFHQRRSLLHVNVSYQNLYRESEITNTCRYSCLQIRVAYTTKDSTFNDPWSRIIPLPDYDAENETEYGNIADTYEE